MITVVTQKVWLPRSGRREDPNVRIGQVVSYQREAGNDYVNPSGCLDGKINETVRIQYGNPSTTIPPGWEVWASGKGRFLAGWSDDTCYPGNEYVGKTGGDN